MAVYDGFFDAVLDESTFEYDREYNSDDFTGYFGELIGSGVCVHENENSMLVGFDGKSAVVAPGYLFIRGYWLKNTENYNIQIPTSGTYAILATLNTGDSRIELGYTEKAEPEKYEDALVLAYVTIAPDGSASVEDTRHRTDICGVINSAGSLSKKVEFAINYIDNEIDGKLAEADALILEQSAMLDKKVEEVNAMVEKMAPPPIGTVKFSASSAIEDGWLRCDGRFISEADYPELVAALGKHTPGERDFSEVSGGSLIGNFSNGVIYNGRCWVYDIDHKKLHGFPISEGDSVSLTVDGSNNLSGGTSNPVVLSICDGVVYLAQSYTSGGLENFLLYEATQAIDDVTDSISIERLDVYTAVKNYYDANTPGTPWYYTNLPGEAFVPEVVSVKSGEGSKLYLCLGALFSDSSDAFYLVSLYWDKGDFSTASCGSHSIGGVKNIVGVDAGAIRKEVFKYGKQFFRFNRKNENEMFYLYSERATGFSYRVVNSQSVPSELFKNDTLFPNMDTSGFPDDPIQTSAVCYNGTYIYRAFISDGELTIRAGKYQPQEPFGQTDSVPQVLPISIPPISRLFPDSVECAASQGLWMIFVGTGLAFSRTPLDLDSWGYLDTTSVLGTITGAGGIEYDEETNTLCITGRDTTNKLKVGMLKFGDLYAWANDGAWLPMIASDGVPAYIKALEV